MNDEIPIFGKEMVLVREVVTEDQTLSDLLYEPAVRLRPWVTAEDHPEAYTQVIAASESEIYDFLRSRHMVFVTSIARGNWPGSFQEVRVKPDGTFVRFGPEVYRKAG